jgi:hypothetical protein
MVTPTNLSVTDSSSTSTVEGGESKWIHFIWPSRITCLSCFVVDTIFQLRKGYAFVLKKRITVGDLYSMILLSSIGKLSELEIHYLIPPSLGTEMQSLTPCLALNAKLQTIQYLYDVRDTWGIHTMVHLQISTKKTWWRISQFQPQDWGHIRWNVIMCAEKGRYHQNLVTCQLSVTSMSVVHPTINCNHRARTAGPVQPKNSLRDQDRAIRAANYTSDLAS